MISAISYDQGPSYPMNTAAGKPQKDRKADYPLLIWDDSLNSEENFRKLAVRVSDVLLMRRGCAFDNNINQPENYDIYWGRLNANDHKKTTHTFTEEGAADFQDFSFFEPWYNKIAGMILRAPDKLDVQNLGLEYLQSKLKKQEDILMERLKRKMVQAMQQESEGGMDLSFAQDESIYVPDSDEELLNLLTEGEQLSYALWMLITASIANNPVKETEIECLLDMFISGIEVTMIKVRRQIGYTQAYPERVPPGNLAWIGKANLKDLDKARAIGAGDYITLDQALEEYGWDLKEDPNWDTLEKVMTNLKNGKGHGFKYDPNVFMATSGRNVQSSAEDHGSRNDPWSLSYWGDDLHTFGESNWLTGFYPGDWSNYSPAPLMLRMPFIFKVIKKQKRKITINGRNPTEEEKKSLYRGSPHLQRPNVRIEMVEEDYEPKSGEHIVTLPIGVWYEGVRLGHCILLGLQPYRYDQDSIRINDPDHNRSMIVMRNMRKKSIVTLGKWFGHHANNIMYHLSEQLNMMGAQYAVDIYDDELPAGMSREQAVFFLKKVGVRIRKRPEEGEPARGSQGTYRVGNDTGIAGELINLYLTLMSLFDQIIGPISNNTLAQQQGLGQTRILADQGSLAIQLMLWEHTQHWGKVYERMGDILKIENEDIEPVLVHLGKGETRVLTSTKGLSAQDMGIYFANGTKAMQDKAEMEQAILQVSSAGGDTKILELLFEMRQNDNPMEAWAKVKKSWDTLQQLESQREQQSAQLQQAQVQAAQQKNMIPIEVANIQSQTELQKTQMKIDADLEKHDDKLSMEDVKAQNTREEMLLKDALEAPPEQAQGPAPTPPSA